MERLVSILFRESNIVLEPLGHRDEDIVQYSEDLITPRDRIRDYPDGEEVIEVARMGIGIFFSRELLVDTVGCLDPVADVSDRNTVRDHLSDHGFCLREKKLLFFSKFFELLRDARIFCWMEDSKTLRLKHLLHMEDTQSISNWGIDIERLEGNPFAFFRIRMEVEGLHVMESICELHDDDTEVFDHSDEHLAKTLNTSFLTTILDR